MCEFCTSHGEGKKWYLNTKNYGQDLLSDIRRKKFIKEHLFWTDNAYKKYFKILKSLPLKTPIIGPALSAVVKGIFLYKHWGQVMPIEEMEKVLELANSITRLPCICHKSITGKETRKCFFISLDPGALGMENIVDHSYFGGPDVKKFEKVSKEWALDFMRKSETQGMFHTIWTFKAPFIGGFCNCDASTGCIPMKMLKEVRPVVFKSEYVVKTDIGLCNGCQECIKICQFGAIKFDGKNKKASVDAGKCYGCGICRSVCKIKALTLKERGSVPVAAGSW